MDKTFLKIRFLIFTQSYTGYRLAKLLHGKDNKKLIKRLAEILGLNEQELRCFIFHKSCRQKFKSETQNLFKHDKKVDVYLQIEKELINLTQEREKNDDEKDQDYNERVILSIAVERVAGNNLSYIKTDSWFDKRLENVRKQYIHWYYKVVDIYKLPTMRIIPFLLRVMSIKN